MIPAFTRVANLPTDAPGRPVAAMRQGRDSTHQSDVVLTLAKFGERFGRYLLLAAIVTLLVRPADLFPALGNAPIYQALMAACIVVSFRGVLRQVTPGSVAGNIASRLSLLFVATVMLSHLVLGNTYDARLGGVETLSAFVVLLLITQLIDTPSKFRGLLVISASSVGVVAVLAVLHFYHVIQIAALATVEQEFAELGQAGTIVRLCGVGIFNDPNDFALMLVFAIIVCLVGPTDRVGGKRRLLMLVPITFLGFALYLTHSRSGFLSGVAAVFTFLVARLGWRRALPTALLLVPALVLVMSRRQTSVGLDDPDDTFQTRLGLWSDALEVFRSAPITGIGQGKLVDVIGQVAHNSFLHAFAELGVLGGSVFLGMFYVPARALWRTSCHDRRLECLRAGVLAILVAYGVGLLSLSRCYTVPTQFILGISMAYILLVARAGGTPAPRWGWPVVGRIAGVSAAFLLVTYLFVRLMIHRGGA